MKTSGGRRAASRALAVTATAATVVLLAAPVAGAAEDDTYVPEPTIELTTLTPVCDGDVPYLEYAIAVTGTDNDTATITWLNPGGENVVQSGLPLQGRVLWPGAVVGADGRGADWPGWSLVDGQWVEGDEFDWVRPSVQVLFQVNPETVVSVDYPPSSPNCATNPPGRGNPTTTTTASQVSRTVATGSSSSSLATTGATVGLYAAVAAGLAAVGAAVVLLTRRTRKS